MKMWFFTMKRMNGSYCLPVYGTVAATDEESAKEIVWEKYGDDYSCCLAVFEVADDGSFLYE